MLRIKNVSENKIFYATSKSAGFDICANEDTWVNPGEVVAVATGLFLEETQDWEVWGHPYTKFVNSRTYGLLPELQIRSRSGIAFKKRVFVLNSPGTIDPDFVFPNEIRVLLYNAGKEPFGVTKGDRIAQGVVALTARALGIEIKNDERTGGFGSTGVK